MCFVFSWDRTWCNLDLFLSVSFSLGILVPPPSMREMKGDSSDRHSRRLPTRLSSGQSKLAGEDRAWAAVACRVLQQVVVAERVLVGKLPWFISDGIAEPIVCGHT